MNISDKELLKFHWFFNYLCQNQFYRHFLLRKTTTRGTTDLYGNQYYFLGLPPRENSQFFDDNLFSVCCGALHDHYKVWSFQAWMLCLNFHFNHFEIFLDRKKYQKIFELEKKTQRLTKKINYLLFLDGEPYTFLSLTTKHKKLSNINIFEKIFNFTISHV